MNFENLSKNMEIKLNDRCEKVIYDMITVHENQIIDCINWMYENQTTGNNDVPDVPDPNNLLNDIVDLLNFEQEINENIIINRS